MDFLNGLLVGIILGFGSLIFIALCFAKKGK